MRHSMPCMRERRVRQNRFYFAMHIVLYATHLHSLRRTGAPLRGQGFSGGILGESDFRTAEDSPETHRRFGKRHGKEGLRPSFLRLNDYIYASFEK